MFLIWLAVLLAVLTEAKGKAQNYTLNGLEMYLKGSKMDKKGIKL